MKKTNRRKAGAAAAAFCLGLPAALGVITGTSAYMTDHAEKVNCITVGWNTTEIEEEFPSPTPAAPGDTVAKKVRIRNTGSVPCYIRAALLVSEGTVTPGEMDTDLWIDGEDGYYYYRDVVQPGDSTTELFTGVRIDQEPEGDTVAVTVYEESVQAFVGTVPCKDYQEAWKHYQGGGGE